MTIEKILHLYLVADCVGETLHKTTKSVKERFKNVIIMEHFYPLIKSYRQIDRIIEYMKKTPGILMYTIIDDKLRNHLKNKCQSNNIEAIAILSPIILRVAKYFDMDLSQLSERSFEFEDSYFKRMEAINFSLVHDDGQNYQDLDLADIIIVGVSRTSKSPTSIYLANKGFKTANVPFISGVHINEILSGLKNPLIVGLTIASERLIDIRKNRVFSIGGKRKNGYTEIDRVMDEVVEAKKFFTKNKWPIIDVTKRSVEETAAKIIQYYNKGES